MKVRKSIIKIINITAILFPTFLNYNSQQGRDIAHHTWRSQIQRWRWISPPVAKRECVLSSGSSESGDVRNIWPWTRQELAVLHSLTCAILHSDVELKWWSSSMWIKGHWVSAFGLRRPSQAITLFFKKTFQALLVFILFFCFWGVIFTFKNNSTTLQETDFLRTS